MENLVNPVKFITILALIYNIYIGNCNVVNTNITK